MRRKIGVATALLSVVLFCGVTLAQEPVVNIDKRVHPNLGEAQRLIADASRYIDVAQRDKQVDMKGHALKAKQLLIQANLELKAAAEAADASLQKKHEPR
jgi:hypothetical protein